MAYDKRYGLIECDKSEKQTFDAGSSTKSVFNDRNLKSAAETSDTQLNISNKINSKTIDELERTDSSGETAELIEHWSSCVKPGEYRISSGRRKKYHPPKHQRNELLRIEARLWEIINGQTGAAEPVEEWRPEGAIQQPTEWADRTRNRLDQIYRM